MAKERNNIYAVTADAVDLALDTAGTIGSMVGGLASAVGLGTSESEKEKSDHQNREAEDAANRVSTSLREEAEAVKPRSHKAHATTAHAAKSRATKTAKKSTKSRSAKTSKSRSSRKASR